MGNQEPPRPPKPPGDRRSRPHAPRLRLSQLRRGQTRSLALRLVETRARDRLPTEFFLDLKITCEVPDRMYSVEVKADLGRIVPYVADLTVLRSRHERTPPVALVERGVPVEKKLSLEVDGSTERVVFWVRTAGAACVPERMAATVEVRLPVLCRIIVYLADHGVRTSFNRGGHRFLAIQWWRRACSVRTRTDVMSLAISATNSGVTTRAAQMRAAARRTMETVIAGAPFFRGGVPARGTR